MNVSVNDVSELRKELTVSLAATEVAEEEQKILKEFQKQAQVPGFRTGKAPAGIIRQRYRKALNEKLGEEVLNRALRGAVEEKKLEIFTVVEVPELGSIDASQELTLDVTVDLQPTFDLPTYKGIEAQAPSTEVSDAEVDEAIEQIRRERADFNEVEKAAEPGDYVKLSYTGKVGEEDISAQLEAHGNLRAWASVENGWEEAGTEEAKQFGIPAVIDGVVGMSKGETKTVTQVIADDFAVEALRGQTVSYEVTVHEVRERVLPTLDEEFLKSLRVETLEELKGQILDNLENQKNRERSDAVRRQIIEELTGAVEFPLPETAVEAETQNVMGRIMIENLQRGVPEEEFEKNKETFHAQSATVAMRDVKLQFILSAIAKAEEISVTQEDLQRGIMSLAMQQRRSPDELVKELQKDRNQVNRLQQQLLFGKTLDFLVNEAKVEPTRDGAESSS